MLILDNIWKTYETHGVEKDVLCGVNATIRRGEAVGILGRNGAGKSTLLRILGGLEMPSRGRLIRRMSVSWPLGYGGAVQSSLTGADNTRFIARIYNRPVAEMLEEVEEFAQLGEYFKLPVKTYSSGMQGRLGFALSMAIDFDCYLVDEVLAAGDARFVNKCRLAMEERRSRSSLILVSHQPYMIKEFCTTALVLEGGRLRHYEDLDEALAAYQAL